MSSTHELLYDRAMMSIQDLFSDSSVSQSETRRSLRTLVEEIEMMMDTLEEEGEE